MELQPTLSNDLVLLRPLKDSDYDALYAVAKDPKIWEQHPKFDRYKKDVFQEFFQKGMETKVALVIIDKERETIIGSSRFNQIPTADNAIEIGWTFLARDYWGGKYNASCKKLMIEHAFNFVEHVMLYIDVKNYRSQKAAQKIGAENITESEEQYLVKQNPIYYSFRIKREA